MAFYNPKTIYDVAMMPKVEGWEESNGCSFVRFYWVFTDTDQKKVEQHWRPEFYRHSLINTKMALATHAGVGVPGWDPFLGKDRTALSEDVTPPTDLCPDDKSLAYWDLSDQTLGTKIAQGKRIEPTGIEDDPRVWRDPDASRSRTDIVGLLRDAAARYKAELDAEHAKMLASHAALKSGSWAQRATAPRAAPTREEARKCLQERRRRPTRYGVERAGVWQPWEIEEITREEARQDRVEAAWQRAEASYKAVNPTWGGGT